MPNPNTYSHGQRRNTLESLCYPALLTATDPAIGRTVDDFLWDYMGDPIIADHLPRIVRTQPDGNEYVYDESIEKGYTDEGTLVHVRRSMGGAALSRPQRYTYFVATAAIDTGAVTEWRINDVRHTNSTAGLSTELVLTTDVFDVHDGEKGSDLIEDPIRRELARRTFAKVCQERDEFQARVTMSSQGVWFKAAGGQPEMVHGIIKLIYDRSAAKQYAAPITPNLPGIIAARAAGA